MGKGGGSGRGRGGNADDDAEPTTLSEELKAIWVTDGPRYLISFTWFVVNVALFFATYITFDGHEEYEIAREKLGEGLPLARASAKVLNLNCSIILIPVCRNLISLVRGSSKNRFMRILDKNITFHKAIAWTMLISATIHTVSHLFNVKNIGESNRQNPPPVYTGVPTDYTEARIAMGTVAGFTGHVVCVCMFLMFTSSIESIRRPFFEVFWYTHHLFIVFFACLVAHGTGNLVRKDQVLPAGTTAESEGCIEYTAGRCLYGHGGQFWKWLIGPFAIYVGERILRFYRSMQSSPVTKVVQHPSDVIELQIKKAGWHAEPGQYVFIHCPAISQFEWHPFTLSSSPEEEFLSVHIRCVGDWTYKLADKLGINFKNADSSQADLLDSRTLPRIAVDGPFGTPTEDAFNYEAVVCVGGGIGVTPFASVLKSIWYQTQASPQLKLRKVYFFWICRDRTAFEWFKDLLEALEEQMEESGRHGFLDINIYLTGAMDKDDVANIMLAEEDETDAITGLRSKTNYGRPNWNNIFTNLARDNPDTKVGVFFCGPAILSKTLHKMCNKYSSVRSGTIFEYSKENF